jgi:hypothetical protein
MTAGKFKLGSTQERERPLLFGPDAQIELRPWVTGHPVGLVIAIGLGVFLWIALPPFRGFLIGALALGVVIGALLWWKHYS